MESGDNQLVPRQADLLYLIYQYFQTVPGLDSSARALCDDLTRNSVLGTTTGWDGNVRTAEVHDIARTYPNISPDHIVQLLQSALTSISSSPHVRPSLLHQIHGVFNPSNSLNRKRYVELSSKLAEILGKQRATHSLKEKRKHRIAVLENVLSRNIVESNEGMESDDDSEIMIPDIGEDVVPVLQEVGRTKELTYLKKQTESTNDTCDLLKVEVDTLTQEISRLGCLTASIYRGHLDSGLCWLQAREMGLTSLGCGSSVSLGRSFVPSAMSIQNKAMCDYRLLWTVSGHMMNPAYCCVFDQTGRYILSGADDYLVKIWDVATGRLIRTCKGHMGYISLVAVSPDNSLFASACTMGTIRIWRLSDGICLQVLKHKASVNWIKFDRTSCALASASDDGHCIVWDLSKLLPEDGGEVPILDVIMEDRATALKSTGTAGAPKISRELEQLNDDLYDPPGVFRSVVHSIGMESDSVEHLAASTAGHSSSSSSSIAPTRSAHVGEARLISAVSSSSANMLGNAGAWGDENASIQTATMHAPIQLFNSRGGLFRWSGGIGCNNQEESEAMLILHHVEDMFQVNRAGDPLKVQCLDISPLGNILVTGCEDGVARVWRIGDPEQVVGYSIRQTRMPMEEVLMKLRAMCTPNEYHRLKRVASHLLMRLEGHVSPITDIHLNHLGDRVLTGSAQDCSVRIWSLSRDHTKSVQVLLDLTEEEEEDGSGETSYSRVRGGRNARMRQKSQLYNACWTSDSSKIVTIQSVLRAGAGGTSDSLPTRLKVWDAMTGDLLKVIWKISDVSSRCLCKHPLNPSIVATCGEDGIVNVWDVDQEERLSSTRLYNDDKSTPSNIVDASFSDDGTRIAVTDFLGRLSVLGLEDPDRYRDVRAEQYFSTDYLDIMLDNVGFAIDVGTQLPVHEAPIGPLIQMDGTPYDTQPSPMKGPPAKSRQEVRALMAEIAEDRKRSAKEMDKVFATFSRNQSRGRLPRKYRGHKPKSIRRAEERAQLGLAVAPVQRESKVQYIEFDVNTYNPSSDESEDSDYRREFSPDVSRTHRFRNGRSREPREPRETRARVATLQNTSRRSNRARTQVSSYNEDMEDIVYTDRNTVASRGARAQQRENRRRQQRRADNDCDSDSDSETDSGSEELVLSSDEEDGDDGRTRRSERARAARSKGHKHRSRVIDDDEDAELEEKETAPRPKKTKPAVFYQAKHGTILSEGVEVGRKWLQAAALTPQYSPQLGDKVMYFPQGHIQWLQEFQESSSPPWMSFPQKWPIVECEVRNIQYMFPDTAQEYKMCCSVKAKVELAVVRIPVRNAITSHNQYTLEMAAPRATRHSASKEITFSVTLRDWDMPDFLIPSDLFMRSIRLAWHTGVRVCVQFKDYSIEEKRYIFKTYTGQVQGMNNASAEWPHSPWDCIQVNWDDTEENSADAATRVGPWEAIPQFDSDSDYAQILAKFPLSRVDESVAARIDEEIGAVMDDPENETLFNPFQYEVDSGAFPSYYASIPVPMYVELIRNRLKSGYYRQIEALEFDINLMHQNCVNYNYDESEIVQASRQLKKRLLHIIRPEENVPVTSLSGSTGGDSSFNGDGMEPSLTLKIRGSARFASSQNHLNQEDYLITHGSPQKNRSSQLTNTCSSLSQRSTRGGRAASSVDQPLPPTSLRIKRSREEMPSPVNTRKARRQDELPVIAAVASTELRSSRAHMCTSTAAEYEHGRRYSGRSSKKINYAEEEEEEEEEEEMEEEDQGSSDEDNGDHSDKYDTRRENNSGRASRQKSRQVRSSSSKNRGSTSRSGDSSGESNEGEDTDENENVTTTRSRRIVKAPANFAAEMAATLEEEHMRAQSQRSSRRKELEQNSSTAPGKGGARLNPSQRNQEQQQEQQRSDRERNHRNLSFSSLEVHGRPARRVDPDVKRVMLQLVDFADSLDSMYNIFADPVTEDIAPGYFQLIQHPVDLQTVREDIHKRHYETVAQVIDDINQMYDNCELYNDDASVLGKEAIRQRKEFLKFCKKQMLA